MKQIVNLARLFVAGLVLALLGLAPLTIALAKQAEAPGAATPSVPDTGDPSADAPVAQPAQESRHLRITKVNCPAGVVPDLEDEELRELGEDALFDLGCVPAEGALFDVRVDGERVLVDAPTVGGELVVEDLPPRARVVVQETVPPGYEPVTRPAQTVTVRNQPVALLFVNQEIAAATTADLTIVKLNCAPGTGAADIAAEDALAEAVLAGEADLAGLGCELADRVPFAVDGVDVGATDDGLLVVEDLPAGARVTVSETVPAGFEAIDPEQTVIVNSGATALFVDVAVAPTPTPEAVADLTIIKVNCQEAIDPETVDVSGLVGGEVTTAALPPDCQLAEDVGFTIDGQDAGETVGGLLVVEDLPVGAEATIAERVPPGFEAQTPEQVTTIFEGGTAVLFVNVAVAPQTADLLIVKLNCDDPVDLDTIDVEAVVEAGVTADALGAGCEPAEDVPFTVDGDPVGTTEGGVLNVEGFAVGTEITVTETAPAGFTALDPEQTIILEAGDNAVLFLNVPTAPEVADLFVIKLNCSEEVDPARISSSAVLDGETPPGCDLAEGVPFAATDATGREIASGTTEDGLLVFEGLPFGAEVTVVEAIPRFFRALDPEQTATIGDEESLLFIDVRGRGRVEAVKYFCGDQDRVGDTDFFVADAEIEGCRLATEGEITFALSGPAGEVDRVATNANGVVSFGVLAGRDYVLTEVTPDRNDVNPTTGAFPVETNETVALNVVDYVPVTGDVLVGKLLCADLMETTIKVARFGVAEQEELGEFGCVHEAAEFIIYPYGDREAEAIEFETGLDGIAYLPDVPVTTDATGPHLLVELASAAEESFTVGSNELTVIEVVNAASPPDGAALVAKQVCLDAIETEIQVAEPNTSEVLIAPSPDPGCDFAAADFAIYPYGFLDAEPITFETGPSAPALLPMVPVTTAASGSHLLVEEETGIEVNFEVESDAVTVIEITNPEEIG